MAHQELTTGDTIEGRWQVVRLIARGRHAVAYEVIDRSAGTRRALVGVVDGAAPHAWQPVTLPESVGRVTALDATASQSLPPAALRSGPGPSSVLPSPRTSRVPRRVHRSRREKIALWCVGGAALGAMSASLAILWGPSSAALRDTVAEAVATTFPTRGALSSRADLMALMAARDQALMRMADGVVTSVAPFYTERARLGDASLPLLTGDEIDAYWRQRVVRDGVRMHLDWQHATWSHEGLGAREEAPGGSCSWVSGAEAGVTIVRVRGNEGSCSLRVRKVHEAQQICHETCGPSASP
jgi:hypothetical protein